MYGLFYWQWETLYNRSNGKEIILENMCKPLWHLTVTKHIRARTVFIILLMFFINTEINTLPQKYHDDVIKWKHFPRNWPFVREMHRSPVNFPHKGQWRGALMFSLIYAWINDWVNNREAGDLRRQHGHYDVIVMIYGNLQALLLCYC